MAHEFRGQIFWIECFTWLLVALSLPASLSRRGGCIPYSTLVLIAVFIAEFVFGVGLIKGRRRADITFCDPIYADTYLDSKGGIPRTAAEEITRQTAAAIRASLE